MRVLIADDHDLLRDTLVMFLEGQGNIETQIAANLDDVCAIIEREPTFDLIVLDYNMPGMNGFEGLTKAIAFKGGQRVALMSSQATREIAERALEEGAAGFVPKTLTAKSMVNAVRFMGMGEQYAPIELMKSAPTETRNALAEKLSPRELQVLEGLTEGKSNKEIARDLEIQEPTVKLHMKTLYRKLEVANRTQAALIAREEGLF